MLASLSYCMPMFNKYVYSMIIILMHDLSVVFMLIPPTLVLLVAVNLQLKWKKISVVIPGSCIVCFIQRTMVSLETPLYGFAVVIKRAASDDCNSFLSRCRDNAVTGHNLRF